MMADQLLMDSATIIVVRDGEYSEKLGTLEVLMVKRHKDIDFAGGAYVFPGGKVDAEDLVFEKNIDDGFSDFLYTAFREVFEESGLIIGEMRGSLKSPEYLDKCRKQILDGTLKFADFIKKSAIEFHFNDIVPFARWITPKIYPKRYDTRFFLAKSPQDQQASPDHGEVVEAIWGKPLEFIEEFRSNMMFPTIMNLQMIGQSLSVKDAFEQAQARKIITVEPQLIDDKRYIDPLAGYGEIDQGNIHQGFRKPPAK